MILDSAAAIRRATNQVGQPDGAGACLANVYKWFGSVPSIGPGAGQYDWAIKGWTFAPDKHAGDYNAPAGVPVYFDALTAPRWAGDRNYRAGDVGLSIGGGYAIFTDSPTGNTGIMSIRARAAQIGRRYLGWTGSFLGHQTTAGNAYGKPVPPAVIVTVGRVPVKTDQNGDRMYSIRNNAKGSEGYGAVYALAPGYVRHEGSADARENTELAQRLQGIVGDAKDINDERSLRITLQSFGLPAETVDPKWIKTNANAGERAYSAIVAAVKGK